MDFYGTIGPACAELSTLQQMVRAGMTGLRMNLSHGSLAEHADWLELIQKAGIRTLLIDLQGPELRIGRLASPLTLSEGQQVFLGTGGIPCPACLLDAITPGQKLLLDDGKLLLRVNAVDTALHCTVLRGGLLQSRKSIAVPGVEVPSPTLTDEDLQNLRVAADCGVTGVMLPFVRSAEDIRTLRAALEDANAGQIQIFAKIENLAGVRTLPEFLPLVDQVVIARGDLGNAMPLWELPRCQKQLASLCRAAGVPFMVVTQMLDSMQTRAVPTRAEVSDIYNAVLDGAASLMLTACGGGGGSTSADAQAETAVMAAINQNRPVSSVKLQNSSELRKTANQSIDAAISGKLGQLSSDFKFVLDPNPEDGSVGFTLVAKCDYKNTDLAKLIKTVTNINSYNMNKWSEVGVVVRTVDGQTYIAISVAIKTKT